MSEDMPEEKIPVLSDTMQQICLIFKINFYAWCDFAFGDFTILPCSLRKSTCSFMKCLYTSHRITESQKSSCGWVGALCLEHLSCNLFLGALRYGKHWVTLCFHHVTWKDLDLLLVDWLVLFGFEGFVFWFSVMRVKCFIESLYS